MAIRRRFGNLAEILLKQRLLQQNAQQQSDLAGQRQKELSIQNYMQSLTNEALKNQPLALRLQRAGMPGMDPLVPTRDDAIQGTSADIEKADSLEKVMTPGGIINRFNQAGQPAVTPGPTEVDPQTGLNKPNPSAINDLLDQNYAKRTSLENAAAPIEQKSINPDTGSEQEQLVNPYKAVGGPVRQVERNATQQGNREATINDIQAPGKWRDAGRETGAREAASAPYHPTILTDSQGDAAAVTFGPGGGKSVSMPPGLSKGTGKSLPVSEVETLATMGAAENEGVKILDILHKSGLDQSNDPLDPRWQKFVVGTLKIAPGDWQKADLQQRAAYVQATMLRSLMQGRPSKWMAEVLMQHLPDGSQSGQQLAHVLSNVMQQINEKRDQYETYVGRPLKPAGATYRQWIELNKGTVPETGPGGADDPAVVLKSAQDILNARKKGG